MLLKELEYAVIAAIQQNYFTNLLTVHAKCVVSIVVKAGDQGF